MMKTFLILICLYLPQAYSLEDGETLHSSELMKQVLILKDSENSEDLYMAKSILSVLKMENEDKEEIIEDITKLENQIDEKIKNSEK